jgi:hypothetical protein
MRELSSVVLEMERQGKRLHALLRVGRLNTMTRDEFREMVAIVDRLSVNLTDFNVLHFGLASLRHRKRTRKAALAQQPYAQLSR